MKAKQSHQFDVIVIGGGVNGTGVARDCALRGLKVCLIERNDLGFGASGNSSGMIHGGPRYLTDNPEVTRTSCLDSGYIQKIAPHLLFRIPFLMPVHRKGGGRIMMELIDAFFGVYDRYQPLKRGKPHTRLTAEEARALEPGLSGDLVGAVSFDEWGIDGARLCAANALDAAEHGATIRVHTSVETIERDEETGAVSGVAWRDFLSGRTGRDRAPIVVNATGAWATVTTARAKLGTKVARVRPGKGIHIVFDRRLTNYAVVAQTIDGRQIFLEPWQNVSVLGTTDTDYYGDLDRVFATSEEVRYLVQGISTVFPDVSKARMIGTFAGVRPTLYEYGPAPDALSREHELVDHEKHGASGLISMIGGKLASYRLFAQEATDLIARKLDVAQRCTTGSSPLPGGEQHVDPRELSERLGIDEIAARRLVFRHGARALTIAQMMESNPGSRRMVCTCESVTEAEIRYVVRNEFARTVDDVARRTRLGHGPCGGMRCAARCAAIVGDELDLKQAQIEQQVTQFARDSARRRMVALGPQQARQEALIWRSFLSQVDLFGHYRQG